MALKELDTTNFDELVLKADKPVLVDFWAAWCGPCRMVRPILEKLAGEMTSVTFYGLNVDLVGTIARKYKITNIPTMMLFRNGEIVETIVGAQPKDKIVTAIAKHLA
ncbi:MAG: thioredoxin [Coriobacteriales bacterium]